GTVNFHALIAQRQKDARPLWQGLDGDRIPTRIVFDNHSSRSHTVIEIEAEDRIGLLFVIAEALTELGLDIALAKILTEKGAAQDNFYVTSELGGKIDAADYQKHIER